MLNEIRQTQKDKYCGIPLSEAPIVDKFIQQKIEQGVPGAGGGN